MIASASKHARKRLVERYGIEMSRKDWRRLSQQIKDFPRTLVEQIGNKNVYEAQVRLLLSYGNLTIPVLYESTRRNTVILTVLPGGYWF